MYPTQLEREGEVTGRLGGSHRVVPEPGHDTVKSHSPAQSTGHVPGSLPKDWLSVHVRGVGRSDWRGRSRGVLPVPGSSHACRQYQTLEPQDRNFVSKMSINYQFGY